MIDNPLPDQVMRQMDADADAQTFESYCKSHAIEIAKHFKVFPDLHDDFAEWYHDYMSQNTWDPFDYTTIYLDDSYIDDWWDDCHDDYDDYVSPYEDFDPTPDGDSPYSDAEYIITPEERNRMAFESKRESHGRGNPFNW
tara:strand:- start:500 stop:919 length:420 start_codon:yes stop_codon:yes gene_type:complete